MKNNIHTHKRITIIEAKKSFLDLCDGDKKKANEAYNIAKKIVKLYDLENNYINQQISNNDIIKNK